MYSLEILHALGSMFGRPLKINNTTYVGSRPSLAHVLVELNITKKYSDKILLGLKNLGYIQKVEMEEFLSFCVDCKCIGHIRGECLTHCAIPIYVPIATSNLGVVVENTVGNNMVTVDISSPSLHGVQTFGDLEGGSDGANNPGVVAAELDGHMENAQVVVDGDGVSFHVVAEGSLVVDHFISGVLVDTALGVGTSSCVQVVISSGKLEAKCLDLLIDSCVPPCEAVQDISAFAHSCDM